MHNGTILLVDDEPEIIKLMQIYLENEGYRLLMARDGLEALEQISRESIDVMVLDVMMPNMDGVEACMKIRKPSIFRLLCCLRRDKIWTKSQDSALGPMITSLSRSARWNWWHALNPSCVEYGNIPIPPLYRSMK